MRERLLILCEDMVLQMIKLAFLAASTVTQQHSSLLYRFAWKSSDCVIIQMVAIPRSLQKCKAQMRLCLCNWTFH